MAASSWGQTSILSVRLSQLSLKNDQRTEVEEGSVLERRNLLLWGLSEGVWTPQALASVADSVKWQDFWIWFPLL